MRDSQRTLWTVLGCLSVCIVSMSRLSHTAAPFAVGMFAYGCVAVLGFLDAWPSKRS